MPLRTTFRLLPLITLLACTADPTGPACGDTTCAAEEVCCVSCEGVRSCGAACPGVACIDAGDGADAGAGTDAGGASGACAPQDVGGEGPCDAEFGPFFLGTSCGGVSGCSCVGTGCSEPYDSEAECARRNRGCVVGCGAQDAAGEGACEAIVGVFWDGSACVTHSGCSCVGADCDAGYVGLEGCAEAHRACE